MKGRRPSAYPALCLAYAFFKKTPALPIHPKAKREFPSPKTSQAQPLPDTFQVSYSESCLWYPN